MIDLDALTQIIEQGLDGLPEDLKRRHRAQLLEAFESSLNNKARAIVQRSAAPDLALLSIRELKRRAKQAGVSRYGQLDKAGLIAALTPSPQ
jgi:hypothetical protein